MSTVFAPFQIAKWTSYWWRPYILRLSFNSVQVKITCLGVVRTTTRGTERRFKGCATSGTTDSFATKRILWGVVRVTTSNIAGLVGVGENKVKEFYTDNRRICCCLICFCSLVTITAVDQIALVQRDRRLHLQMQFRKSFLLKWQGGDPKAQTYWSRIKPRQSLIIKKEQNICWSKISLTSIFTLKKFHFNISISMARPIVQCSIFIHRININKNIDQCQISYRSCFTVSNSFLASTLSWERFILIILQRAFLQRTIEMVCLYFLM